MRPKTHGIRIAKTIAVRPTLICALICTLFAPTFGYANDLVMEVIPLHYRSASEIEPLVRDFVAKGGTIKAADNKLIVRTYTGNMTELRALIAKLDAPPRRLIVTVKQLSGERAHRAAMAREGRVWQTEDQDDHDRIQRVEVLENKEAFIDVGREIPISDFAVAQSQSGTIMEQKTRYIGATTGFYVRARIDGNIVNVEISPRQKNRSGVASPPEFSTQALRTTISGQLGEWITIGTSSAREQTHEIIEYSASKQDQGDRRILLQVTVPHQTK